VSHNGKIAITPYAKEFGTDYSLIFQPGDEQIYEFRATQYGSTYYHAHDGIQSNSCL
jgi:Uma2 family endonuclease